jgi:ubiquinone/menaquinone biosynthesis C-methylase UbiE
MNHSHDRLIHWARAYDLTNGLLGRRRKRLREMFADDLELQAGDRVLDVGCGTGRLAMIFAERVAPTGSVAGIDAADEMIKRAASRARKQDLPVAFEVAFAQRLPFPTATFDAVACMLALHHVAEDDQQAAVQEMYRVLKPDGRLLIAEFDQGHGPHLRLRWLRSSTSDHMTERARRLVDAAGFTGVTSSPTNLSWLSTISARKGAAS